MNTDHFTLSNDIAIVEANYKVSYQQLSMLVDIWRKKLETIMPQPTTVAIIGDYSIDALALIIALIKNRHIIVPLLADNPNLARYFEIAEINQVINLETGNITQQSHEIKHPLLTRLLDEQHAGLVLFTSGSTGQPKAVVHDFERLLTKFANAKKTYVTLCFLMFDHIAGIDTYLYTLLSGGTLVLPKNRHPKTICQRIEQQQVEVLPTSPTFLNLLVLSKAYERHDLRSLKIITFGSEPMPAGLITRLKVLFPRVKLVQKYGVTELGSPPSKSNQQDVKWIKLDSQQYQMRIVNGTLHIKSAATMLGYLNADNPITVDGWFNTGDKVEEKAGYIRVLGRESEMINVGGEKVYPAEVEEVIQAMDGVDEVVVSRGENAISGQMVVAKVQLTTKETRAEFRKRMLAFCQDKLPLFKIPQKVILATHELHNQRYKKMRV